MHLPGICRLKLCHIFFATICNVFYFMDNTHFLDNLLLICLPYNYLGCSPFAWDPFSFSYGLLYSIFEYFIVYPLSV